MVWLTALYPLWLAWQANRQTSLHHAISWVIASWAGWGAALASAASWPSLPATASCYVALSLTGCAAVAVLGARRPGVHAWNFVVVALLAVDLLALAESLLTARALQLNVYRLACVAGPLAVGVLNYLPTQLAPAALALLVGCILELVALVSVAGGGPERSLVLEAGWIAIVFAPWVAYTCLGRQNASASAFDRLWLDFRNRFGLVWSQRLREQFNRSAANARWPVVLRWQGLRLLTGAVRTESAASSDAIVTLRALLKRFGSEEDGHFPEHR